MIHDARYLLEQRERSPDLDDNGQWERVRLRSPSVGFASCHGSEEQDWRVREAEDVCGGARFAGVGGKPVPAEQSEVAGHGREGRLPRISLRAREEGSGNMQCTQV